MDARQRYESWLTDPYFDGEIREELQKIAGDHKEIEERFYRDLEFGTGRTAGNHWRRDKPHEYLYCAQSHPGVSKLYRQRGKRGKRRGHSPFDSRK